MPQAGRLKLLVAGISFPLETFLARLLTGLAQKGIAVELACAWEPSRSFPKETEIGWLPTPSWKCGILTRGLRLCQMAARALVRSPRDVRKLSGAIRKLSGRAERVRAWYRLLPYAGGSWDVIYFPWNAAAIAYQPLFELGRPVIVSCRGTQVHIAPHDPSRPGLAEGLRLGFQKAAAVHCVSRTIREEAALYGLDRKKARIIPPSVDPEFFRPREGPRERRDTFRIVTAGWLTWIKAHETALAAMRRLLDRGVSAEFVIIGEGPDRDRILYTVNDLKLQENVRLLGELPPEELRDQLDRTDAFLLSSVSEGISNAVLEAMACGLPIVTTDCGGMREAVGDGVEGFVVPVRDPEAIAAALGRLACDRGLRARMGKAARERVLRDFALADQIRKFADLCEEVAGSWAVSS